MESNDVNTFNLTNTPTSNSTQSNTAFGTFDLTAHNWNVSRFVTGTKNVLGQQELKYKPELNLCQEEVLLYNIDRDDFFFSTSLLHLKSRHAVTEFFDTVFGLVHLRESHIHEGIKVSNEMYLYMKGKFQDAKANHIFMHVGSKDRSNNGTKNIDFIKITNEHVMKLFNNKSDGLLL